MTELKGTRKITRKVDTSDPHGRQLVITLHARHLELRPFGTRENYTLDYHALLQIAATRQAEKMRIERAVKKQQLRLSEAAKQRSRR